MAKNMVYRPTLMDKAFMRATDKAIATLESRGWERVASMLVNDTENRSDFGIRFKRHDQGFWLNWKTIDTLPDDGC